MKLMITTGMLIENNYIDGVMIPIENAKEDLTRTNSYYWIGTIPETMIEIPAIEHGKKTAILEREEREEDTETQIYALGSSSRVNLPIFGEKSKDQTYKGFGLTTKLGITDLKYATNITAVTDKEKADNRTILAWSAFRTERKLEESKRI